MPPWPECLRLRPERIPRWSVNPPLQSLLPDAPFALVKIPELAAGHYFPKVCRRRPAGAEVGFQCLIQSLRFPFFHLAQHGVGTQACNLAPDIADGRVHGIGEGFTSIAAHDEGPLLSHE